MDVVVVVDVAVVVVAVEVMVVGVDASFLSSSPLGEDAAPEAFASASSRGAGSEEGFDDVVAVVDVAVVVVAVDVVAVGSTI